MIREIEAKTILNTNKHPSSWFGVKYGMNIYRGCQHRCIYCDSRSDCYRIENFDNAIIVKINAIDKLKEELSKKRKKGTIGTGAMSDPYMPIEKKYKLTRKSLEVISDFKYTVNIATKSNLVLRDIDLLEQINKIYANVTFTITTTDDELAKKIEPLAPLPSERLKAMGVLSSIGIRTGVLMMPILPYLEDNEGNIKDIAEKSAYYGARYIYPAFGVTLRDSQRVYYYKELDKYYPGLSEKYKKKYGDRYSCGANNVQKLKAIFRENCLKHNIMMGMISYEKENNLRQLSLF